MKLDQQAASGRRELARSLGIVSYPCAEEHWPEWARCKSDPVYFTRTYGWTYDPRLKGEKWIPFDLWPRQAELLQWWDALEQESQENSVDAGGVVDKSRDTGVSWCVCAYTAWKTVFFEHENTGLGAALEEQVDHPESEKAVMWKLRGFLDHLPSWMLPKPLVKTFKMIVNPNTGSRVEGQAGLQIGRGGRTGRYFIDEFAFVADSNKVLASVSGNTSVLFPLSTVNGVGNAYHDMLESEDWPTFTIRWQDDPRKGEEWKAAKIRKIGAVIFAQEFEGDATNSSDYIVCPGEWVRACVGYKRSSDDVQGLDLGPGLSGLDIGQGTAATGTFGIRQLYLFLKVHKLSGLKVSDIFTDAKQRCLETKGPKGESVVTLCYDASGSTGKAASDEVAKHRQAKDSDGSTEIDGICVTPMVGQKVHFTAPPLADGRRATDVFANWRAYAWWCVRERARKTWENVNGQGDWPLEECLSLPPCDNPLERSTLEKQLSAPWYSFVGGKIKVENKFEMRVRGVRSPDEADCLVLSFVAQPPPPKLPGRFARR